MSGRPTTMPTLAETKCLLAAAQEVAGPAAATLALSILTLGLAWEITAIRVEDVDWSQRKVEVPQRGGRRRVVPLNGPAMALVSRLVGDAPEGQVVTGCRGAAYAAKDFRHDRIRPLLAAVDPQGGRIAWNMHGIRRAGASRLVTAGCTVDEVRTLLGLERSSAMRTYGPDGSRAAAVWANLLA